MNWKLKTFNELEAEEIYNILKLRNEVFIVEQQCAYLDCDGKDKHAYHLFLEDQGKVVAYVRILEKGLSFNEVSIGRVLVDKEYRGNGLAKEMMEKAIHFTESKLNETTIKISAQTYLIHFYGSLGFQPVSREYLEDGIPHIDMLYQKNNDHN